MAGGRLFRGFVTAPAIDAMLGWSVAVGALGLKPVGASERPVSMMWWPAEWSFDLWVSDRTAAHLSERAASSGRCSQTRNPGGRVGIEPNSPRIRSGAAGFGAKPPGWARPPARRRKTTRLG